ncbi:pseudouridine synthase [Alteromonas oceanisediminis]|uniref:pseudouridine synthase n=1 Tax=Alteromonas oceanisediminis TaxID=2836180 RepID=UPI001BDAE37E|nr:pseudouridine synthase [Alteromonas oceanisediminis]MBT0585019.1 tRNA pseudouridine(65) synthase TruC [Alteromonas oceanisediminis]
MFCTGRYAKFERQHISPWVAYVWDTLFTSSPSKKLPVFIEPLTVLYRDDDIVVIDKPPGLLVHRSLIAKRETHFAVQMLRDQLGCFVYPVHRLDRPTSGVLVFALSSAMAATLTESFTQRQIRKHYRAIVRGHVTASAKIDYPLREILDKKSDKRAFKDKPAQSAQTQLTCVQRFQVPLPVGRYHEARFSYVALSPHTGRKHQLRRHMAHVRHPIIGDTTHGDGKQNAFVRHHFNGYNLALSCTEMHFPHPRTGKLLRIATQPHTEMARLLASWTPFRVAGSESLNIERAY